MKCERESLRSERIKTAETETDKKAETKTRAETEALAMTKKQDTYRLFELFVSAHNDVLNHRDDAHVKNAVPLKLVHQVLEKSTHNTKYGRIRTAPINSILHRNTMP